MSDVTGASMPIKLDGEEYFASPLDDEDIVELDHWLQQSYIATVRGSLKVEYGSMEAVPDSEYDRAMRLAYAEAKAMTWTSGEGAKRMGSVEGVARVLWHQLKKRHPELTHADVCKMMFDVENVKVAREAFQKLDVDPMTRLSNGVDSRRASKKGPTRKDRRKRRKKERSRRKRST